ncbi:recombinase family protein [Candidatus Kaiserbacteria bacterium]|nr:recombinase family protein [Candidatus Kaiserbacteria bacterium]
MQQSLKYFVYARKSSEDSQRQIASIDDQINALKTVAEREGLAVARVFKEEMSAKDTGRPIFNDMVKRIVAGEANALLCWDVDRLSRNPRDSGELQHQLLKSVIKAIKTPGRTYFQEDAGLLMSIEGGRAMDYVMRLSKNVKRGLTSKALRGWRPGGGPIGYINVGTEKGSKTIANDPERFEIVRKMWDLFLSGTYSVSKIREIAINEWHLTTLPHRKIGGKPLSMSHMYNIFNDTFYCGYYPWTDPESGERKMIKGNHQPMITENEFRRAQVLLGKRGKQQPHTREFAFTGLMRCGECDSSITAEEKNQIICTTCKYKFAYENKTACPKCITDISEMQDPKILNYVYYRCTKKKNRNCSQKTIRLEELEKQFNAILAVLTIDQDYLKLALDFLNDVEKNSGGEERAMRMSLQSTYDACQKRLVNLSREFTSPLNSNYELYTQEEFKKQKMDLVAERDRLEKELGGTKEKLDRDLETAERVFTFCAYAQKHFNTDDLQKKRTIFATIGSNLTLKDRKLSIERLHPYLLIENELKNQRSLQEALEPEKEGYAERKEAAFAASIPDWLPG